MMVHALWGRVQFEMPVKILASGNVKWLGGYQEWSSLEKIWTQDVYYSVETETELYMRFPRRVRG